MKPADTLPPSIEMVRFTQNVRCGLANLMEVKADKDTALSLLQGLVVVRREVEREGRRVVITTGVPLGSGIVTQIHFAEEPAQPPEAATAKKARAQ